MTINPIAYNATPPAAADAPGHLVQQRELRQAVQALNRAEIYGPHSELSLAVDETTHRQLFRVIDKQTKEVLLQIPPESVLRMAKELRHR